MGTPLPVLTPVEQSLFITLYGRALDGRGPDTLLGDTTAEEIARKLGRNPEDFPMARSKIFDIAVRAKRLDEIVSRFVARHPDAVVVELGAGLDSRMFRVDPPPTVDWYDVDLPGVAATREQMLSLPANAHQIAADVCDTQWLTELPHDRPAVIVADGLVAFLATPDFWSLLNRLTDHFPDGTIAFNGYTRFHVWAIKHYRGTGSIADIARNDGFDDPREPERWDPALRLDHEILLTRTPEVAHASPGMRLIMRLFGLSAYLSRRGTAVLVYRF